jgi:uncharacterized protein (TIGR02265 family)
VPEKLVFEHTVESLLRALERPYTPAQIAGLDALGIDLSKPLLPGYPVETYGGLIDFVARQRWPDLPLEQGQFEAGQAFIHAYRQTLLGKALSGVLRTIGPHRVIERMTRTFRTANNFTETRLRKLGPANYELWFNYASRPHYFRGMVHAVIESCGAKQVEVKLVAGAAGSEVTLQVTWQP